MASSDYEIIERALEKTMETLQAKGELFSEDYPRNAELELQKQVLKQLNAEG